MRKKTKLENFLWIIGFLAVLGVSAYFVLNIENADEDALVEITQEESFSQRLPTFDGEEQASVADEIRADLILSGVRDADVRFVEENRLEMELAAGTSPYLIRRAKSTARDISQQRLNRQPIIGVYIADTPGEGLRLPAPTD